LTPEPGPVGVSVDPLGEPLGASALPDGFVVLPEMPLLAPVAMPVVEPGGFPVGTPFVMEPVVVPVVPEPVAVEPVVDPPCGASASHATATALCKGECTCERQRARQRHCREFHRSFPLLLLIKTKPAKAIDVPAARARSANDSRLSLFR
jgi:hypothetical protein